MSRIQPFAMSHEAAVSICLDRAQGVAARTLLEDVFARILQSTMQVMFAGLQPCDIAQAFSR